MPYTFPELSIPPLINSWEEKRAYDPTLRTEVDGGYTLTRPRTSRTPIPKTWHIKLNGLDDTDKLALETFEDTVQVGAAAFNYTNPKDLATYSVRFKSQIVFKFSGSDDQYWTAEFDIEQV